MENECCIVRDILPLYLEGMVREETADFVRKHLANCAECAAEYDKMRTDDQLDAFRAEDARRRTESARALMRVRKGLRKRGIAVAAAAVLCLSVLLVLLYHFPVYRIAQIGGTTYYSAGEALMISAIGSREDRAVAQTVLRQADVAFHDCRHTRAENQALYGALARYATDAERGAAFVNHSLELLSAHIDGAEGYLWVLYSQEVVDTQGRTICASRNVPSLWRIGQNAAGEWTVFGIKEHP